MSIGFKRHHLKTDITSSKAYMEALETHVTRTRPASPIVSE